MGRKTHTEIIVRHLPARRGWYSAVQPHGLGNPFVDSGGHVLNSFRRRVAIGHAAGKIRHHGEIAAAVFGMKRAKHDTRSSRDRSYQPARLNRTDPAPARTPDAAGS